MNGKRYPSTPAGKPAARQARARPASPAPASPGTGWKPLPSQASATAKARSHGQQGAAMRKVTTPVIKPKGGSKR